MLEELAYHEWNDSEYFLRFGSRVVARQPNRSFQMVESWEGLHPACQQGGSAPPLVARVTVRVHDSCFTGCRFGSRLLRRYFFFIHIYI